MFNGLDRITINRLHRNVQDFARVGILCSRILYVQLSQFVVDEADKDGGRPCI